MNRFDNKNASKSETRTQGSLDPSASLQDTSAETGYTGQQKGRQGSLDPAMNMQSGQERGWSETQINLNRVRFSGAVVKWNSSLRCVSSPQVYSYFVPGCSPSRCAQCMVLISMSLLNTSCCASVRLNASLPSARYNTYPASTSRQVRHVTVMLRAASPRMLSIM